jgi:hypothetical protein
MLKYVIDTLQAERSGGSNPGGGQDFLHPSRPASCTTGTGSLSQAESGRGVTLTTHPHLAPRLKKGYSYTSTHPSGPSWQVTGLTLPSKTIGSLHKPTAVL